MTRNLLDAYYTETPLTEALLYRLPPMSGKVIECCCGNGAISDRLWLEDCDIYTNDIDQLVPSNYKLDASLPESWAMFPSAKWVITNPPFNKANEIVPLAYEHASVGVAMLLRLSWLEPVKARAHWLQEHSQNLSNVIIFSGPRPSFTNNSRTDSATTAWMVWRKDWSHGTKFEFVTGWKE